MHVCTPLGQGCSPRAGLDLRTEASIGYSKRFISGRCGKPTVSDLKLCGCVSTKLMENYTFKLVDFRLEKGQGEISECSRCHKESGGLGEIKAELFTHGPLDVPKHV